MLGKMIKLIDNLAVYQENIKKNLELTGGLVFSQVLLLKLASRGVSREDSYAMVQGNAMKAWDEGANFKELILNDKAIMSVITKEDFD